MVYVVEGKEGAACVSDHKEQRGTCREAPRGIGGLPMKELDGASSALVRGVCLRASKEGPGKELVFLDRYRKFIAHFSFNAVATFSFQVLKPTIPFGSRGKPSLTEKSGQS